MGRFANFMGRIDLFSEVNPLVACNRRSKDCSESSGTAVNLAQRIRFIRFRNLHPNGLVFCT